MDVGGNFTPHAEEDGIKPYPKFSIHTTGVVHYYEHVGGARTSSTRIEPLTRLTRSFPIGFVSVPRISRLERLIAGTHHQNVAGTLEFPAEVSGRLTFAIEIGPNPLPHPPNTYGLSLNYELYCVVVRLIPSVPVPVTNDMLEHVVFGATVIYDFGVPRMDEAVAEIEFNQKIAGHNGHTISRANDGRYTVLAVRPMVKPPRLRIEFYRDDLYIEQIPFENRMQQPTHKVSFWICDKGGRNKKDDLTSYIRSITLNAEL